MVGPAARTQCRLSHCLWLADAPAPNRGPPAARRPRPQPPLSPPQNHPTPQRSRLESHPAFEAIPEAEVDADPAAQLLAESSEEGQKVARNGGTTYRAVFRRRADY